MNNDKNNQNKKNNDLFSYKSGSGSSEKDMRVNTQANIKMAVAKKTLKKGGRTATIFLKKTSQYFFSILLTLVLFGTISGVIIGASFAVYVKNYLIDEDYDIIGLKDNLDKTTKIYYTDSEGKSHELEDERIFGTENRSWASYQNMPQNLIDSFIAIEDERFWTHKGVDWKRTVGAVLEFVTGNDSYGGSTITQQLIKNVSGEQDTTIQRKVREIFRALSLTDKRSKQEVIEMYLNTINLSRSNYGVQAASNYYFGKDVSELTLIECAALASIPKSPTKYDPVRNPENNKERRNTVLTKMLELGWITKEEYDASYDIDLELHLNLDENGKIETQGQAYSYFKDALIEQIISDLYDEYGYSRAYASNLIYSGGLEIHVTMDPFIQNAMEEVFKDDSNFEKVSEGIQPECAMVIMNPYNGNVLGIVGGRGEKTDQRGYNRATQSKRQVGSSIKPLTVYAPAVDLGLINYSTVLDDTPFKYMENLGRYWPSNSPARYDGKISVNDAIRLSKNTIAVKVLDKMSVDYSFNFAKKKLHLDSLLESDKALAPLALGGLTKGLTVLEMAAAYSIFPNEGCYSTPRLYTKIYNYDGTILLEKNIKQESAISVQTSIVMNKMLQNVVTSGTASRLTLDTKIDIAGKTGTTNDNRDLYFVGYTPYYVGACWFGYDVSKNLAKFKTNPHMVVWEKVMEKVHQPIFDSVANGTEELEKFDFSKLQTVEYCLDSGLLPSQYCNLDIRTVTNGTSRIATGYFYEEEGVPTQVCNVHVPVKWDKSTNRLAGDNCPEGVLTTVALIEVNDRNFTDGDVKVSDANYTYREVPEDYVYPETAPFYKNLPGVSFCGYFDVEENKPANAICTVHKAVIPEEPEIPDENEPVFPNEPDQNNPPPVEDDENTDLPDVNQNSGADMSHLLEMYENSGNNNSNSND